MSVAFSLVELIFGCVSLLYIRKMVQERGLRLLINQDLDNDRPVKKKADLRRLILLAKPVSENFMCNNLSLFIILIFYSRSIPLFFLLFCACLCLLVLSQLLLFCLEKLLIMLYQVNQIGKHGDHVCTYLVLVLWPLVLLYYSTDKYGRNIPPNVTNCVPYTMSKFGIRCFMCAYFS